VDVEDDVFVCEPGPPAFLAPLWVDVAVALPI
jgi:hypothetical protein